ncbi:MAG: stage III sporulation protein AF [Clostridia bacterium]|nr:stage III sporulation protein AF [Clostridia bacterium]
MKVYLLTAAGVIFLSVIVSLLIPEGKLHKTVTFVMRLICIFVLIQPVTGLFNIKETNSAWTDDFFDYEYVCKAYSDHQSEQLEILLEKEFETDTDCTMTVEYKDGEFKVTAVGVELNKNNGKLIEEIYAYLDGLGYINITVYAKSS